MERVNPRAVGMMYADLAAFVGRPLTHRVCTLLIAQTNVDKIKFSL